MKLSRGEIATQFASMGAPTSIAFGTRAWILYHVYERLVACWVGFAAPEGREVGWAWVFETGKELEAGE